MKGPSNAPPKTDVQRDDQASKTIEEFDFSEIDGKSAHYLRILEQKGGRATTTELRERGGFSKSAVHYRHDKLSDLGLVVVESPDTLYDGKSASTSKLTDLGHAVVEKDCLPEGEPGESLERLEKRVEGMRGSMKSERQRLERRIDSVEDVTEQLVDFTDDTVRSELEIHRLAISRLLDRVDELEEKVEQYEQGSAPRQP